MISVNGPVTIQTRTTHVVGGVWSDGSVSFETVDKNKNERRYWLTEDSKGRIISAGQRKAAAQRKAKATL